MKIWTIDDFDYNLLDKIKTQKRPKGNPRGRKNCRYKDVICAFDIETTNIKELKNSFMYIWQFQFGLDYTIVGRTWKEYLTFLERLKEHLEDEWIVIFVHNLSFEFQFLSGVYKFDENEVFATDKRKVLKAEMYNCFEYRCSYLHSNMGLAEFTKKMGVENKKLSGEEFNYSKMRYPWTELTENELQYCINDVKGLVQAITIEMTNDGDSLYTYPLTSTGYVRRDVKRAMYGYNSMQLKAMLPDENVYLLLRQAYRGGNCHANRYFAGDIVENVKSFDRSSSYPDVMVNCEFPMSEFQLVSDCSAWYLTRLMKVKHRALVFTINFTNIRLTNKYTGIPYLSTDKCRNIVNGKYDNGRILSADYLETTLTDIDFRIVLSMYSFDSGDPQIVYKARYGKLPKMFTDVVIDYYKKKTELKGIDSMEYYYNKAKNKLNATYGMCVQDVGKQSILYRNGEFIFDDKTVDFLVAKNNRKAFLNYAWGVWVSAWARYRLQEGIDLCGDNIVYCDTDSCKYVGEVDWNPYNEIRKKDSLENGAYATDSKGEIHYMGVYESEGVCERFKTMGAKKYAGEMNGKLKITIAGVNKKKGAEELQENGGLSAMQEGFIFTKAGGTESTYNDLEEPIIYKAEGREISVTSNIYIEDGTYTLGLTEEYEWLLQHCFDPKYSDYKIFI